GPGQPAPRAARARAPAAAVASTARRATSRTSTLPPPTSGAAHTPPQARPDGTTPHRPAPPSRRAPARAPLPRMPTDPRLRTYVRSIDTPPDGAELPARDRGSWRADVAARALRAWLAHRARGHRRSRHHAALTTKRGRRVTASGPRSSTATPRNRAPPQP